MTNLSPRGDISIRVEKVGKVKARRNVISDMIFVGIEFLRFEIFKKIRRENERGIRIESG